MADISLHAFILHQNHLKIKINPVPAPKTKSRLNNCIASCINKATIALIIINKTVDNRPTATNFFSDAFGFICCL